MYSLIPRTKTVQVTPRTAAMTMNAPWSSGLTAALFAAGEDMALTDSRCAGEAHVWYRWSCQVYVR